MKNEKHQAKKNDILESAFRIWGKDRFRSRSLAELAAAHDMTKQALYRYFSSKDKLETAMEERALEVYNGHSRQLLDLLATLDGEAFVTTLVEESMAFIRREATYLSYLSHRYRHDSQATFHGEATKKIIELAAVNAGVPEVGIRYLNALIFMEVNGGKGTKDGRWRTAWRRGRRWREHP